MGLHLPCQKLVVFIDISNQVSKLQIAILRKSEKQTNANANNFLSIQLVTIAKLTTVRKKSKRRNMKQVIVLIAVQLCLCVCTVRAVEDCPAGFERVEGMSIHKCFYYYVDSTGNMKAAVNFSDALKICKGKNATVFEPDSREEGDTMWKFVKEKRGGSSGYPWINYRDIVDQASFVGVNNSVFVSSSYMGSLSTMDPIPVEWWSDTQNKGGKRREGYHCANWYKDGVADAICTYAESLVCEKDASQRNLKEYIKSLDKGIVA